jgi:hypothetical protein
VDDLVIKASGDDITLSWTTVNEDTLGSDIEVAAYRIYVYPSPTFSINPEYLLEEVSDTTLLVEGVLNLASNYFFIVSAVDSNTPPVLHFPRKVFLPSVRVTGE